MTAKSIIINTNDMLDISPLLMELFENIELVQEKHREPLYHYIHVSDKTSEYEANYFLAIPKAYEQSIASIFNEFEKTLISKKHYVNDDIIIGLMILFSLCPKDQRSPDRVLKFLNLINEVKLKQYLFFDGFATEKIYQLKFFDYTIGELNYDKFAKFLRNHAKTDYAIRYKKYLQNRPGVEVKSKSILVVDPFAWMSICGIDVLNLSIDAQNRVNMYLGSVSNKQFINFKNEFYEQQQFITAYFGVVYTIEDFERMGCRFVNVFYGFMNGANNGWVFSSFRNQTQISFPDPKILRDVNSFLKQNSESLSTGEGPFIRYLKIASEILTSGEKHLANKNANHAFIDFFVALDFLLAPDTEKSKKLKNRISLLVYKFFNRPLREQIAMLDKLYDQRSDYVHNGKAIDLPSVIELRDITKVILGVIFNLHKKNIKSVKDEYADWIKSIDEHLDKFYNKGVEPNQKAWVDLGTYKILNIILHNSFIDSAQFDL